MSEPVWMEAAAGLQSDLDAVTREEAYEVFVAEAARSRLVDRTGDVRITLRCGHVVTGRVQASQSTPQGLLALSEQSGRVLLIPVWAVLMQSGSGPALRHEGDDGPTLGSALREAWSMGGRVRALLANGRWLAGVIDFVGADHVDLRTQDGGLTVPFSAVEAWDVGALL